jgi:ADP-ribose pyrophosphatase YjhB (NUDIX family)
MYHAIADSWIYPTKLMNPSLRFERPLSTVDLAIFSIQEDALRILLVRRPVDAAEPFSGEWALPGGFVDVDVDRDLESCAFRKLKEKTGITAPYLEQVGSWGNDHRDPRGWSATHVYFALISADELHLAPGGNASDARWVPVDAHRVRVNLAFDHAEILKAATTRLRNKVEYTSLPAFLMPAEFTLGELQRVYEIVLGRKLEKKAFRTRMLAAKLLEATPRFKEGANRPAQLYRLKHKRRAVFFSRTFGNRSDS